MKRKKNIYYLRLQHDIRFISLIHCKNHHKMFQNSQFSYNVSLFDYILFK